MYQNSELKEKIKALAIQYFEETRGFRHHIHSNPELSFEEYNTSKYIQEQLDKIGIPYTSGVAGTGIVGLIRGKNPDSRTVALRGDMDALPILEKNNKPYKSKNEGVMHACGHDVHSSCVLGAARILNEIKDEFEGTIKLIFQPGEEKFPGGASLMIKDGVLENPKPNKILGQHVHPPLSAGKVGFRPGIYMASADEITIIVKGKGGHAALPQNNVDPILISAHLLTGLQQIVSRNAHPATPSVLSFGKIQGGNAGNVIPDEVHLEGTFRTFDEEWRIEAHKKIKFMAEQIAISMGGECEVDIRVGYPFLKNDEETTLKSIELAKEYLGEDNVEELPLRMTAEDFSYFTHHAPSCFYRLGTGNVDQGITSPVHTATFDIDEEALKTGTGLMAWIAINS